MQFLLLPDVCLRQVVQKVCFYFITSLAKFLTSLECLCFLTQMPASQSCIRVQCVQPTVSTKQKDIGSPWLCSLSTWMWLFHWVISLYEEWHYKLDSFPVSLVNENAKFFHLGRTIASSFDLISVGWFLVWKRKTTWYPIILLTKTEKETVGNILCRVRGIQREDCSGLRPLQHWWWKWFWTWNQKTEVTQHQGPPQCTGGKTIHASRSLVRGRCPRGQAPIGLPSPSS